MAQLVIYRTLSISLVCRALFSHEKTKAAHHAKYTCFSTELLSLIMYSTTPILRVIFEETFCCLQSYKIYTLIFVSQETVQILIYHTLYTPPTKMLTSIQMNRHMHVHTCTHSRINRNLYFFPNGSAFKCPLTIPYYMGFLVYAIHMKHNINIKTLSNPFSGVTTRYKRNRIFIDNDVVHEFKIS